MEAQKILNAKILKITLTIREDFPDLVKYLEVMPVIIPNGEHPEITAQNRSAYYNSLMAMLGKYLSTPQPTLPLQPGHATCE